jgi:hypothetical protein
MTAVQYEIWSKADDWRHPLDGGPYHYYIVRIGKRGGGRRIDDYTTTSRADIAQRFKELTGSTPVPGMDY